MKTKTCKRSGCKFFHVTGTKKSDSAGSNPPSISTSNAFNPIAVKQTPSEQVFLKEKESWELAIEKMSAQMELMMKWQQMQTYIL